MNTRGPNDVGGVRLYVLDTGLIQSSDFAIWSPSVEPGTYREMSVRSYLVVHPEGALLWDTGIADRIAGRTAGEQVADTIVFRVPRTLASQLKEIGREPDGIGLIGLSHMHIDHVGNLDQFPAARVVMQQAERDAAFGAHAEQLTYIPDAYSSLDRGRIEAIVGEHDLFGDGTVMMVPLPGHTPGHQGLLVRLRDAAPILLAGDIAYSGPITSDRPSARATSISMPRANRSRRPRDSSTISAQRCGFTTTSRRSARSIQRRPSIAEDERAATCRGTRSPQAAAPTRRSTRRSRPNRCVGFRSRTTTRR